MIKVNLVPAEILAKAQAKQRMLQASAAGVAVLCMVLLVSGWHFYRFKRLEGELAEGQAKLKKLEIIVAKVEELEKTAAAVRARLNVVTDLLKYRAFFPTFMSDFAKAVPSGIRIRQMNTTGGGSGGATLKLQMQAEARAHEDIAAWVRKMEESGKFADLELGGVLSTGGTSNFSMVGTYNPKL